MFIECVVNNRPGGVPKIVSGNAPVSGNVV